MSRTLVGPVLVLAAVAAGCGGGGEQQLLDRYFQAARLRDNLTLGNIAAVTFDPREDGIVQNFSIVNVSEERRRPLRVKELAQAHQEARAAAEDLSKRQKAYQDENIEAIDRVLKAERSNAPVRGRDAEVQAAWTKWREEMGEHAKRVSSARAELGAERSLVELSVSDPRNPIDVAQFDGELITKDVTIDARIQTPDQQTVQKQLIVTLQRAALQGPNDTTITGRWIITEVREAGTPSQSDS